MTELYQLALGIAKEAHKGQKDKAGVDYIQHPIFVASLLDSEEGKAAALLHDVIEDSDFTLSDLLDRGIPNEVLRAVAVLTKSNHLSYQQYLKRVKGNDLARKVKLADLRHNSDLSRLQSPTKTDLERAEKYKAAIEYLS